MKKELKYYLKKAKKERWAIGQFNFSNLEQLQAILAAAIKKRAPVIVGTSVKESLSIGLKQAAALVNSFRQKKGLPVFLNLDHGRSLGYIKEAIDAGYQAVHFDGSELDLEENIKITNQVIKYAQPRGVVVEGEVGVIGGQFTDPLEVKKFIQKTKVDSLTINFGSSHGGEDSVLDLKRLKTINQIVGSLPLVLHGGSGVSNREIKLAIKLGIAKINVNTELRLAYTNALKESLKNNPDEIRSYVYMLSVVEEVQKKTEEKIKLFNSHNKS